LKQCLYRSEPYRKEIHSYKVITMDQKTEVFRYVKRIGTADISHGVLADEGFSPAEWIVNAGRFPKEMTKVYATHTLIYTRQPEHDASNQPKYVLFETVGPNGTRYKPNGVTMEKFGDQMPRPFRDRNYPHAA